VGSSRSRKYNADSRAAMPTHREAALTAAGFVVDADGAHPQHLNSRGAVSPRATLDRPQNVMAVANLRRCARNTHYTFELFGAP
jgi:hypothetical protein